MATGEASVIPGKEKGRKGWERAGEIGRNSFLPAPFLQPTPSSSRRPLENLGKVDRELRVRGRASVTRRDERREVALAVAGVRVFHEHHDLEGARAIE